MTTTNEIDLSNEEVQKIIAEKAAAKATELAKEIADKELAGLIANRDEIKSEKLAIKEKYEALNAKFTSLTEKYDFESLDKQMEEAEKARKAALSDSERIAEELEQARKEAAMQTEMANSKAATLEEELNNTKTSYEESINALEKQLKGNIKTAELAKAMSKGDAKALLLSPHLEKDVEVFHEDGEFVIRVVQDGKIRMNETNSAPMTVEELVLEYRNNEAFGSMFNPSKANGGSATGSNSTPASNSLSRSKMSTEDKVAYIASHGRDGYMALPE